MSAALNTPLYALDCSRALVVTEDEAGDLIIAAAECGPYDYIVVKRETFPSEGEVVTVEAALWGTEFLIARTPDELRRAVWCAWSEGRREFLKHVGCGRWICPVLAVGLSEADLAVVNETLAALRAAP